MFRDPRLLKTQRPFRPELFPFIFRKVTNRKRMFGYPQANGGRIKLCLGIH